MDSGGLKPGSAIGPEKPSSPKGMGEQFKGIPEPAERIDGSATNKTGENRALGNAQKGGGLSDKAAKASETAKDIKSIAKASANQGIGKEDVQDVKQAMQEKGVKGAAGEVSRKAVGKGVQAGLDATGVAAPVAAPIGKAVEKGLKKENLKKILFAFALFAAIPLIMVGLIFAIIAYVASNPLSAVKKTLTDPKMREFAVQAAKAVGSNILGSETYEKYGYVEKNSNTAIAATSVAPPKTGSIEEKILKINIKNARYQTNSATSCPYKYTTKEMVGPNGQLTSVIDKITDNYGTEVTNRSFIVNYCIMESMPLFNMMVRTQKARDVNKFSNTVLNYADTNNSPNLKDKSYDEVSKYVYDKTYKRISSKESDDPKTKMASINQYISQVRNALATNQDPDLIQYKFSGDPNSTENITKTLCAFSQGYLGTENTKKAIYTRLNSGQRSGIKWNTLDSTRDLGKLSNEELNPTFKEIDGWNASVAYSQNVYGRQSGEDIDPERIGNTAYGANFVESASLLYDLRQRCKDLDDSGVASFVNDIISNIPIIGGFFGGDSDSDSRTKIVAIYDALKVIIVQQSNGKFSSAQDFGLEQLMVGIIRMGGGSAVSGLEDGPQNFNNQSQGFRALSNQYMMRMGGRFLTKEEYSKLNELTENTKRELINRNGIAYRIFDQNNIMSLSNIIAFESPRTLGDFKRKSNQIVASLSNPIKIISDVHSSISYLALGKINTAYAAAATGDAYMRLNSVGLTETDLDGINLIDNSNEIQNILQNGTPNEKTVLGYFEKCSKSNIPTINVFARLYKPIYNQNNKQVTVVQSADRLERDGSGDNLPFYPSINDQFSALGLTSKKELVACEIYLAPNSVEVARDYGNDVQSRLFGFPIKDLARKYRLYLYANSMVDIMVDLSNTEKTDSIYAAPNSGKSDQDILDKINSGTAQEIAKKILANPNVTYEAANIKEQFETLAKGENPVPCGNINPEILYMVINLAKNHTLQINSLAKGRDCLPQSWHGSGGAIDFGKFDGQSLTGSNDPSTNLINTAISLLPDGAKAGFGNCDGRTIPSNGKSVYFFPDNCNHVHLQIEFDAARSR